MSNLVRVFFKCPRLVVVLAWLFCSGLSVWHQRIVHDYLAIAGELGQRPEGRSPTPLTLAYPGFAADAQTWVRHALALSEGDDLRLRFTRIDNAPHGREVHWNSGWAWALVFAGKLERWISGAPYPLAVERAAIWLPTASIIVISFPLSLWAASYLGTLAGCFLAFALFGSARLFEGFFPVYVDHHGLLTVAVLGLSVGFLFAGAGWIRGRSPSLGDRLLPEDFGKARRAATASALWGSVGVWISAASSIPPIAIVGLAGFVPILLVGRRFESSGRAIFSPEIWQHWGNVGAASSLGFFLLEYAPNHLTSCRLEANNPLYSLAWWAGSRWISLFGGYWLKRSWPCRERLFTFAFLSVALSLPILVALLGRDRVFVVLDPFLSNLHNSYIHEFLPIWRSIGGVGWGPFLTSFLLDNAPFIVALGLLAVVRFRSPVWLWFGVIGGLGFTSLAVLQSRWGLNASAFHYAVGILLLSFGSHGRSTAAQFAAFILIAFCLFGQPVHSRIGGGVRELAAKRVGRGDALSLLHRDIAAAIRASQPEGEIVLLSSPNGSTGVGYYGRFSTLGTLYWENIEGLKAAARIFSARSDEEAASLIRERRVSHIAIVSEENFLAQYFALLNPSAGPEDFGKSFGHRLFVDKTVPAWLRVLPYKVPADLANLGVAVLLLQVAFNQTGADALYHIALSKVANGQLLEAERDFDILLERSPDSFQPYFRKAEMLQARSEWARSVEFLRAGVKLAPATMRRDLVADSAAALFRARQVALSADLYRTFLADSFDPQLAANLAFILSSVSDPNLRDPVAARFWIGRAVETAPDSLPILSAYAVVLADAGDFEGAARLQRRLVEAFRAAGSPAELAVAERRLVEFQAGRPWRD